jgi:hypothetical protein
MRRRLRETPRASACRRLHKGNRATVFRDYQRLWYGEIEHLPGAWPLVIVAANASPHAAQICG